MALPWRKKKPVLEQGTLYQNFLKPGPGQGFQKPRYEKGVREYQGPHNVFVYSTVFWFTDINAGPEKNLPWNRDPWIPKIIRAGHTTSQRRETCWAG